MYLRAGRLRAMQLVIGAKHAASESTGRVGSSRTQVRLALGYMAHPLLRLFFLAS